MSLESVLFAFIDLILNSDVHLKAVIENYDLWTYAILFLIIFCETGLIVTPFLPGDSLLFAAGAFAALGSLNLNLVLAVIFIAAVLGDVANYFAGRYIGPKIFKKEKSLFFNKDYLMHTEKFYEKYGLKTIIAARFMPIVRTFAPFVAGIGKMKKMTFITYNVIGAFLWCFFFILGGYFFGNIPFVKEHFNWVVIGIIVISFMPILKEIIHSIWKKKTAGGSDKIGL